MSLPELPRQFQRAKVWTIFTVGLLFILVGLVLVLVGLNASNNRLAEAYRDFGSAQCDIFNFTVLATPDPTGAFQDSIAFVAVAGVFVPTALLPENRAIVWAAVPYRKNRFSSDSSSAIQDAFGSLAINQTVECGVPPQTELWGSRLVWFRSIARAPILPADEMRRLPIVFDFDHATANATLEPINALEIAGGVTIFVGLLVMASLLILIDCKSVSVS